MLMLAIGAAVTGVSASRAEGLPIEPVAETPTTAPVAPTTSTSTSSTTATTTETTATTAPPPPPTTQPPAPSPAPPATAAPAPAPAPPSDLDRVLAAIDEAVPAFWRQTIGASVEVIDGSTSWANTPAQLQIGRVHAEGSWSHLLSVVGHEYGHLIAYARGSQAYLGAPPAGWPDPGFADSAESWADCVSVAFTGIVDPSYGMPPCPQATVDWTAGWLATA